MQLVHEIKFGNEFRLFYGHQGCLLYFHICPHTHFACIGLVFCPGNTHCPGNDFKPTHNALSQIVCNIEGTIM